MIVLLIGQITASRIWERCVRDELFCGNGCGLLPRVNITLS